MVTNEYHGKKLSALGLGCMRLPILEGGDSDINVNAVKEMVAYAMKNGINYYDTAWGYHSGNSETVMGQVLSEYPRESFFLASKFPGYDLENMDKVEEIFEKQLEKCQVDYFDFYMFHNVCEANIEQYLDRKYGIYEYLMKQKENGRIKHLGFSTHGTVETNQRFLDAYGEGMEFCQIQLNWLDWGLQNAKEKVEVLNKYNIPIWVMEPVRGGKLVKLASKHEEILRKLQPEWSMPEWAFRFLQSVDGVTMTLSGMSNMEQLQENIATYKENKKLSKEEMDALLSIMEDMTRKDTVPCTACRYCTDRCPMQLDIPWLLELYNEHNFSNGGFIAPMALSALEADKQPSACIGCRSCEAVCPQNIKISETLADFTRKLEQ